MRYFEKARKLSDRIAFYHAHKKKPVYHNNTEELNAENTWGASYFCSAVLHKSEQQFFHCITLEKLEKLQEEFKFDTGYVISIIDLINKGWIRVVFNVVSISEGIESAAHYAKKINELSKELMFLLDVQDRIKKKSITTVQLYEYASKYEIDHQIKLDLQAALESHFWSLKEETVQIQNISVYKIILENKIDFLFIEKVYRTFYYGDENNLQIKVETLNSIFERHCIVFPETPLLETFIEKKAFTLSPDGQHYYINFRYAEMPLSDSVHNKTGAILWNNLLADTSFKSDIERIFFWYCRIILRESHCDIADFFGEKIKSKFLEIALEIVLNDSDITNGPEEYWKLKLDERHLRLYNLEYYFATKKNDIYFPDYTDLFELYEGLSTLERNHEDELIILQKARRPLSYFISQLVLNDTEHSYKIISNLLAQGNSKPYIFWYTCFMIYYWRPEVIPFLLEQETMSSLCLNLLYKLQLSNPVSEESIVIRNSIIIDNFSFISTYVSDNTQVSYKRKAIIIYQCLLKTIVKKYKVASGQNSNRRINEKQERVGLSNQIKLIFQNTQLPGIVYSSNHQYKNLLYPVLLKELFQLVCLYSTKELLQNGAIDLPYIKLDLLAYLLQLLDGKQPIEEDVKSEISKAAILEIFNAEYLSIMNCREIQARDFFGDDSLKTVTPSWHSNIENEELIDWAEILLSLEDENLLDDFIDPKELTFTNDTNKYDPYNQFVAKKLRTHLSILLRSYNEISKNQHGLKSRNLPVHQVLSKLENKISSYIIRYSTHDSVHKRYDVFNDTLERGYWVNDKEELLPVLGNALNSFNRESKRRIIQELIKTEQIIRSLKLLDYIVSEEERKNLLSVISNYDISEYLKELSFADLQFVVQNLSKEPKFIKQAEKALQYTETLIQKSKKQFKQEEDLVFAFRTKLLIAHHKNDEKAIEAIEKPIITTNIGKRFSAKDEKDFYKALIYLKKDQPEKSYVIFNRQLSYSEEERPTLALNRFASKLQWADKIKNLRGKSKLYQEAIDEWMEFESHASREDTLLYLKDKIWLNKLYANEALQNDLEFDSLYYQLDKITQLRSDFLEIRIKSLVRRKMQEQAESLVTEAKHFHHLENGDYPEFIYALEKVINTNESLLFLKNQYGRIFRSTPEQLVQILPDNITRNYPLSHFILSQIVDSANDLLTYINSISLIDTEDKYSDLLMLSLNARMINCQWHVSNLRSGFADSKLSNPGEIDFGIFAANKERLAICEALVLKGKNTSEVQKHNVKIFNYDHKRKLFYVIIYYKGKDDSFHDAWNKYKLTVEDFVVFPDGFLLKPSILKSVKGAFENDSIKIAKSKHLKGTELFHIFININYRLPIKNKNKMR